MAKVSLGGAHRNWLGAWLLERCEQDVVAGKCVGALGSSVLREVRADGRFVAAEWQDGNYILT